MKKLAYVLMSVSAALLFVVFSVGPARIASAAVNMSTVAAGTDYLAVGTSPGPERNGFFLGTDKTKLDALPTNATLVATYATQTALANKEMNCGDWGAAGMPGTTSLRWLTNNVNGAIGTLSQHSWVLAPFDGTVTAITARQAFGVADTTTYTLEVNGTPDTGIQVVVGSGVTTVVEDTGSVAFTKGQMLSVNVQQASGTASASAAPRVSIRCKSSATAP